MAEQLMRAQLKGSTASINSTAGYKGVLVLNTDTNHLHILTGQVGNNIELANKTDIPEEVDISGKADKTYVDQQLANKQPIGDYATNTELTEGLATKLGKSENAVSATKATQDASGNVITTTYATKSELSSGLAGKQPTGDYATNTALTEGLETKLNKSDKAESAKSADSILWSNIQNIPNNVSNALSYIEQTLTDEQKEQLVKNLDGTFLPLSGGTLTGQLSFPNGLSFSVGGSILSASTNGDFNWGGNKVERVIAFDSEKASEYANRYVRFASGLQICYGFTLVKADQLYRKATFLAPFTEYSSVTLTPDSGAVDCVTTICGVDNTMVNIGRRRYTDSAYNFDLIVFYQVIGQWK